MCRSSVLERAGVALGSPDRDASRATQRIDYAASSSWMDVNASGRCLARVNLKIDYWGASAGLSLTSRTWVGHGALSPLARVRNPDDGEPEVLDRLHGAHELIEIDRLHHTGAHVMVVGVEDVPVGCRRREDDHRNPPQDRIGVHLGQHLTAVL